MVKSVGGGDVDLSAAMRVVESNPRVSNGLADGVPDSPGCANGMRYQVLHELPGNVKRWVFDSDAGDPASYTDAKEKAANLRLSADFEGGDVSVVVDGKKMKTWSAKKGKKPPAAGGKRKREAPARSAPSADLRGMRVKELKALIERGGLDHADCLDKDALVERAAAAVARLGECQRAQAAAKAAPKGAATPAAKKAKGACDAVYLESVGLCGRGEEHALGAFHILGRSSLNDAIVGEKLPLGVGTDETGISRRQCTLERRGDGAYVATTAPSALNPTGIILAGTRQRALVAPGASRALELGDVVVLDIFEEHQSSDVTGYSFAYELRRRGGVMDDG